MATGILTIGFGAATLGAAFGANFCTTGVTAADLGDILAGAGPGAAKI